MTFNTTNKRLEMESVIMDRAVQSLALNGGEPLAPDLKAPVWPPRSERTAQRLSEVYLSGKWSFNGAEEQAFCREFAEYHGARFGIFMANGTVTLQCALQAHGIGAGDEVIVPALTWPATAMAVLEVGATPVFADVEPSTLCLDPQAFADAITEKTRAVVPVHLYGGMADLDAILEIAAGRDLVVIEDCAHGHGGAWKGRGVGSWGNVGSFSFQESKAIASGEGGICLTNDERLAERLYRLKHIGYAPATAQGQAAAGPQSGLLCHNFRATDFQAVILRDQLRDFPERIATYNRNAALLEERLRDVAGWRVQSRGREATMQSYYAWCVFADEEPLADIPLAVLQQALRAEGLPIGGTYGAVYNHVLWNIAPEKYRIHGGACPVAEGLGTERTVVMNHQWLGMDDETTETIAAIFAKVAKRAADLERFRAAAA
jgi:L-glutamine:2-deoxy-scyllo-inosose/3-amino-2,3-dideoxy-scyllo-inosose aminotransferase